MKDLQINLTGKVTDTNFDEWKGALIKQIKGSKRELQTDDDFALAEQDVKSLKAGEKALKAAKQSALDQAAEIQKLFDAIDDVSEEARQARLSLERQIKRRKEEIRDEIVDSGMATIENYLADQSELFQSVNRHEFITRDQLEDFTKGKRSYKSMQKAIDQVVIGIKDKVDIKVSTISANEKTLSKVAPAHASLFQDKNTLLDMAPDNLAETISDRIAFFEEEQARLKQAQQPEVAEQQRAAEEKPAQEALIPTPAASSGVETRFTVSIEVFADEADAAEFVDELESRYSRRAMVGEIKLQRH